MAPLLSTHALHQMTPSFLVTAVVWGVCIQPKNSFSISWPIAYAYNVAWHSRDVVIKEAEFLSLTDSSRAGFERNGFHGKNWWAKGICRQKRNRIRNETERGSQWVENRQKTGGCENRHSAALKEKPRKPYHRDREARASPFICWDPSKFHISKTRKASSQHINPHDLTLRGLFPPGIQNNHSRTVVPITGDFSLKKTFSNIWEHLFYLAVKTEGILLASNT